MKVKASLSEIIITPVKLCVLFSLLVLPSLLFAQERGKVEVVKDPKVDSLIQGYVTTGSGKSGEATSLEGYRIQIFSGSDRKDAYDAQAKFQERYPGIGTYLTYRSPDFKVHIGDFRSRLEAEKMMQELKNRFTGLFIIPEKINLPKLDTE